MHGDFKPTLADAEQERLKASGPWYAPRQEFTTALARGEWLAVTRQGENLAHGAVLSCPRCKRHSYTFLSRDRVLWSGEFSFECKCGYRNTVILLLLDMPPVGYKYRQNLGEKVIDWVYKGNGKNESTGTYTVNNFPPLVPDPDPVAAYFNELKMSNPFGLNPAAEPGNWREMQSTEQMNSVAAGASGG